VSSIVANDTKTTFVVAYTPQDKPAVSQVLDLALKFKASDHLSKADIQDAYSHLQIRCCHHDKILFEAGKLVFRPRTTD
jgi:hypothetical protein